MVTKKKNNKKTTEQNKKRTEETKVIFPVCVTQLNNDQFVTFSIFMSMPLFIKFFYGISLTFSINHGECLQKYRIYIEKSALLHSENIFVVLIDCLCWSAMQSQINSNS